MKKILLLFFLSLIINICHAQEKKDYTNKSAKILQELQAGEYAAIQAQFDSSIMQKIDSSRLSKAWGNIITSYGPFIKEDSVFSEHEDNYDVVIQRLLFKEKKIDLKIVYGTNGRVKGLFFLPSEKKEKYLAPSYYHDSLVTEVSLATADSAFKLPGMLEKPKSPGKYPLLILVHGSGPNDKDETVGATKIFKDLALGLASKGIVVYRYEKRTRIYGSKYAKSKTLTVKEETIDDVHFAILAAKKDPSVDTNKIYVAGHSLGAMLLPRIVNSNPEIKGVIFLAGNARPLEDLFLEQVKYISSLDSSGGKKDLVDSVQREVTKIKNMTTANLNDSGNVLFVPVSYWLDLKNYNQVKSAQQLKINMLFLQGERDYQVTMKDFNIWKSSVKSSSAKFKSYPSLNHFFISGKGPSKPDDYLHSGNVSEEVVNDIYKWIKSGKIN